jgi:hypothetical protein
MMCLWASLAHGADFSGRYRGVISNESMQLVLLQKGTTVTGTMTSNTGDYYRITGTANGNVANCAGIYSKDNSSWNFNFALTSSGLVWTPTMLGIPLANAAANFAREGTATSRSATGSDHRVTGGKPSGNLDQRFIGSWVHTNTYVSGDFSAASEKYVQFNADGTFAHSNGRVVGGGNSGSFNSGGGNETTHGRWQIQDKTLYYLADGTNNWEAYGHYGFTDDGQTMRIVFGNGNKELWERR